MSSLHLTPSEVATCRLPVLIFHGITATPAEVEPLAHHLAALGHEVYAPLLPGHGTSLEDLKRIRAIDWLDFAIASVDRYTAGNRRIALIGQSFGGLLSLFVAERSPHLISKVVALATPLKFRDRLWERTFGLLSSLPDAALNKLGTHRKTPKNLTLFKHPYISYDSHSYGAIARVVAIRKRVLRDAALLSGEILVVNDPADSHLAPECPSLFRQAFYNAAVKVELIPEGQHQLILGKECDKVYKLIEAFLTTANEV